MLYLLYIAYSTTNHEHSTQTCCKWCWSVRLELEKMEDGRLNGGDKTRPQLRWYVSQNSEGERGL